MSQETQNTLATNLHQFLTPSEKKVISEDDVTQVLSEEENLYTLLKMKKSSQTQEIQNSADRLISSSQSQAQKKKLQIAKTILGNSITRSIYDTRLFPEKEDVEKIPVPASNLALPHWKSEIISFFNRGEDKKPDTTEPPPTPYKPYWQWEISGSRSYGATALVIGSLIGLKFYFEQGSNNLWALSACLGTVGIGVILLGLSLYLQYSSKIINEEAKRPQNIETENPDDIIQKRNQAKGFVFFWSFFFIPLYMTSLPLDYTAPTYLSQMQESLTSSKAIAGHVFFAFGLFCIGKYIYHRLQLSPTQEICLQERDPRRINLTVEREFWSGNSFS